MWDALSANSQSSAAHSLLSPFDVDNAGSISRSLFRRGRLLVVAHHTYHQPPASQQRIASQERYANALTHAHTSIIAYANRFPVNRFQLAPFCVWLAVSVAADESQRFRTESAHTCPNECGKRVARKHASHMFTCCVCNGLLAAECIGTHSISHRAVGGGGGSGGGIHVHVAANVRECTVSMHRCGVNRVRLACTHERLDTNEPAHERAHRHKHTLCVYHTDKNRRQCVFVCARREFVR